MKLLEQMGEYMKVKAVININGISGKIAGIYDDFIEFKHSEVKENKSVKQVFQETILIPIGKIESVSEGLEELEPEDELEVKV